MPLYDYDCAACGRRFEVIHGVHDDGPASCPLCGKGPVRKAITTAAIHFKGSGWAKKERGSASRKSAEKSETGEPAVASSSSSTTSDTADSPAKDSGSSPAKPAAGD